MKKSIFYTLFIFLTLSCGGPDGEILMGYFPETVGEGKVELDDILFYYFKTYPEIAFRRLDDSFLQSSISNSSRYASLIDKITLSLNSNLSPLDDPEFEAKYLGDTGNNLIS